MTSSPPYPDHDPDSGPTVAELTAWWDATLPELAKVGPVVTAGSLTVPSATVVCVDQPHLAALDLPGLARALGATASAVFELHADAEDVAAAVAELTSCGEAEAAASMSALLPDCPVLQAVSVLLMSPQRDLYVRLVVTGAQEVFAVELAEEGEEDEAAERPGFTLSDLGDPGPGRTPQEEAELTAVALAAGQELLTAGGGCVEPELREAMYRALGSRWPDGRYWKIPPALLQDVALEARARHAREILALTPDLLGPLVAELTPARAAAMAVSELVGPARLALSGRVRCPCVTNTAAKDLARAARAAAKSQAAAGR